MPNVLRTKPRLATSRSPGPASPARRRWSAFALRDAGVASGLLNTTQNLGGAIGVAVASSVAASYSRTLLQHGYATAAALTGGFHWALWVCGLTALAAIPVALVRSR